MVAGRMKGHRALEHFGYARGRFRRTAEFGKRVSHADRMTAMVTAESLFSRLASLRAVAGEWHGLVKSWALPACLVLGVAALSGCSKPVNCSGGDYRGGCLAGPIPPASASPAVASPYAAPPSAGPVAVAPAAAGPAGVPLGDPSTFDAVDDKQCRSYGLVFGTHDYADCRIRLSAQHRGLDPNIGTTPPASR